MEDCRRPRSESSTGVEDVNATHIAVSYLEKHYPQYKMVNISNYLIFHIKIFVKNNEYNLYKFIETQTIFVDVVKDVVHRVVA